MRIRRPHNLGQAAAVKKIDHFLEGLMRRPLPAGVKVRDAHKEWDDDGTMHFSFRASKGFLSASIEGRMKVSDKDVVLEGKVPPLVTTFIGEDKIRAAIEERMDEVLES